MTSLARIATSGPAASDTSSRVIAFRTPRAPVHPEPAFDRPSLRPADIARRQSMAWPSLCAVNVQVTRHDPFEYEFRALVGDEQMEGRAEFVLERGVPRHLDVDGAETWPCPGFAPGDVGGTPASPAGCG